MIGEYQELPTYIFPLDCNTFHSLSQTKKLDKNDVFWATDIFQFDYTVVVVSYVLK